MKKLLALAGAAALASCVVGSPAYASDRHNGPRVEQHQDRDKHDRRHDHRRHDYRYDNSQPSVTFGVILGNGGPTYGYYDRGDRRWRDSSYLYWRYFRNLPSYYPGRCHPAYTVVLRDPYTNRLVCMSRENYSRYRYEMRYNRF